MNTSVGLAPPPRYSVDRNNFRLLLEYAGSSLEIWQMLTGQRLSYRWFGYGIISSVEFHEGLEALYTTHIEMLVNLILVGEDDANND